MKKYSEREVQRTKSGMVEEVLRVYFERLGQESQDAPFCKVSCATACERACREHMQSEIKQVYTYCRKCGFSYLSSLYAFNKLVMGFDVRQPSTEALASRMPVICENVGGVIVFM